MSSALSVFKLSVRNVHQLQQYAIEVCFEMRGLPYQWTPVANHSISIARQSSARQCWSVLAYISDSVPASRPTRDNPVYWDLGNSVAIRFFQWDQGISSWSSLAQELLCRAGAPSCWKMKLSGGDAGDACSLWLDLAAAWWRSNCRSLRPFHPQSEVVYKA